MHSRLFTAFKGNSRAGNFSQAVDVICFNTETAFDVAAHFLTPRFCAENAGLQMDLIPQTAFVDGLSQISCVRRRAAENRGTEIRHELNLTVCVSGGHGKRQASDFMASAVESRPSGEQSETVGNMADVVFCSSCSDNRTGTAVFPDINVMLSIKGDDSSPCSAACGLDADAVPDWARHQTVGIAFPQIVLGQKRELMKILDSTDVSRFHTGFLHFLPVIFHIFINAFHRVDKTLILQCGHLIPRRGFDIRLIIIFHSRDFPFLCICY